MYITFIAQTVLGQFRHRYESALALSEILRCYFELIWGAAQVQMVFQQIHSCKINNDSKVNKKTQRKSNNVERLIFNRHLVQQLLCNRHKKSIQAQNTDIQQKELHQQELNSSAITFLLSLLKPILSSTISYKVVKSDLNGQPGINRLVFDRHFLGSKMKIKKFLGMSRMTINIKLINSFLGKRILKQNNYKEL